MDLHIYPVFPMDLKTSVSVLVRVSVAEEKLSDHSNFHKGKHFIGAGLQLQRFCVVLFLNLLLPFNPELSECATTNLPLSAALKSHHHQGTKEGKSQAQTLSKL